MHARGKRLLLAVGLAVASLLVSVAIVPQAAADPAAGAGVGNVDASKWPAYLKWAIPDSPEFNAKFMKATSGNNPLDGCSMSTGGDPYQYTMQYLDNIGQIFQSIGHASGTSVLNVANVGNVRMDIPQLTTVNWASSGGTSNLPTLVGPSDVTPVDLTNGRAICGKDWAQFGQQDPTTAFGFAYYNEPDAASTTYINTTMNVFPGVADTWKKKDPAGTFDPRNLNSYCDPGNPYCLTAAFLHCDATGARASLVQACHNWNYNVAALNVLLEQTIIVYGTVSNAQPGTGGHIQTTPYVIKDLYDRSHRVATAADVLAAPTQDSGTQASRDKVVNRASQGYYSGWLLATDGQAYTQWSNDVKRVGTVIVVGTAVTLGAAAAVGAWWLGFGLLGILAAGASVAAFTVFAGSISCASELAKCLAQASATGFAFTLGLVPSAATALHYAPMTSASWSTTLNAVAGVSLGLLLALFMLNLLFALIRRRPVIAIESLGGVVSWVVLLAVGGSILTLLINARNSATEALGGTSGVLAGMANGVVNTINKLGAGAGFGGWLLIALIALLGMVFALIVYVVLWVSAQWVPLVIGILILQAAGLAAPGLAAGKWFKRGFSILWMLLITAPIIVLIWRLGSTQIANAGSFGSLLGALAVLALCAAAPMLVAGMFSLGISGRLGAGAALMGAGLAAFAAGKGVKGLAGAASKPGSSGDQLMSNQLAAGGGPRGNVATELVGAGTGGSSREGNRATGAPSRSGSATNEGPPAGTGTGGLSSGEKASPDPWAVSGETGPSGRHSALDAAPSSSETAQTAGDDFPPPGSPTENEGTTAGTDERTPGVPAPAGHDAAAGSADTASPGPQRDTDASGTSGLADQGQPRPAMPGPDEQPAQRGLGSSTSDTDPTGRDRPQEVTGPNQAADGTARPGAPAEPVAGVSTAPDRRASRDTTSAGGSAAGGTTQPTGSARPPLPQQQRPAAALPSSPPPNTGGQSAALLRQQPPPGNARTHPAGRVSDSAESPWVAEGGSRVAPGGERPAAGGATPTPPAQSTNPGGPVDGAVPSDRNLDAQAENTGDEPGWAQRDRSWNQLPDTEDPQR